MAKKRSRLTAKQRVLKKWPDAYAYQWGFREWCIYRKPGTFDIDTFSTDSRRTAALAWSDAARRLTRARK